MAARLRAGAAAHLARGQLVDLDLLLHPRRRFLQADLEVVAQVAAALAALAVGAAAVLAAEELLEDAARAAVATARAAEYLPDQGEGVDAARGSPARPGGALRERRVPVAVIRGALVGVAEDVVGLAEFLEPFLGLRVARVLIRVILDRQAAVGFLQFLARGIPGDAEHFVIIAFNSSHNVVPVRERWTTRARVNASRSPPSGRKKGRSVMERGLPRNHRVAANKGKTRPRRAPEHRQPAYLPSSLSTMKTSTAVPKPPPQR